MMAGKLDAPVVPLVDAATLDEIVRIQFYQMINGIARFIPAVNCREEYINKIPVERKTDFEQEFPEDEQWICPQLDSYDLLNDPYLFDLGQNLAMIVKSCTLAAEVDLQYNITTYAKGECAS